MHFNFCLSHNDDKLPADVDLLSMTKDVGNCILCNYHIMLIMLSALVAV